MGMRVRLKASFDTSKFTGAAKVILEGLKTHGMILADNGGDWFISGAPDDRWNHEEILPILKEKLTEAFEQIESDYELYSVDGAEIEHKDRDGFWAWTDGGWMVRGFTTVNYLTGKTSYREVKNLHAIFQCARELLLLVTQILFNTSLFFCQSRISGTHLADQSTNKPIKKQIFYAQLVTVTHCAANNAP
jgi:hypothetical protein